MADPVASTNSREIINLYHKLHHAGVQHWDLDLRHIGKTRSGSFRLFDFDRARMPDETGREEEKEAVMQRLGVSTEWWDDAVVNGVRV